MQKKYLMTPGPTPVPAEVMLTHGRADHPPPHAGLLGGVRRGDRQPQVRLPDRGRRAALRVLGHGRRWSPRSRTASRAGDTVIVCRNGKFGDRQKQIAETYGLNVVDLQYEWTEVVRPGRRRRRRSPSNPEARGVIVTQSETSTGVLNDVEAIGEIVGPMRRRRAHRRLDHRHRRGRVQDRRVGPRRRHDRLAEGAHAPAGPGRLHRVSKKAWKAYERSTLPKFYFDWMKYQKNIEKDTTPFTPAVTLVLGLNESLKMIREEGIENTIARHSHARRGDPQGLRGARPEAVRAARGPRQRGHAGVGARGRRRQGDRQDHEGQVRRHHRRRPGRLRRARSSASATSATSASSTSSPRSRRSR